MKNSRLTIPINEQRTYRLGKHEGYRNTLAQLADGVTVETIEAAQPSLDQWRDEVISDSRDQLEVTSQRRGFIDGVKAAITTFNEAGGKSREVADLTFMLLDLAVLESEYRCSVELCDLAADKLAGRTLKRHILAAVCPPAGVN